MYRAASQVNHLTGAGSTTARVASHARKRSVYPIGFMGAYSLVFADAPEDRGAVDAVDVGELYRSALEGERPTMDEMGFTDAQRDFYEFG